MTEVADVLVVGAGPSGGAFSWRLARAGVKVVCLDRGYRVAPEDYPTDQPDWESRRLRDFNPNPNVRGLPQDYPVDDEDSPIKPLMFCGVGGSTIMWSAASPRFHPSDFRVRTLDGVADDWPLSYEELAGYYDLCDRMVGVGGISGDPANPPRPERSTPPLPLGEGGERMARAYDRLGWHWWPVDGAIISRSYRGRPACNNCGPCEMGCPRGAKASSDVTWWPEAEAAGAKIVTGAAVSRITVDARGRATGALWFDDEGTAHHTPARVVVLAANGLGTPRILLSSESPQFPDGLANSSGLVGRRLMLHPVAAATAVFPENVRSYVGADAYSIFSQEFYETDADRGFVRGYLMQVTRGQGPLITALGGFNLDVPWGRGHHRRFEELFGHVVTVAVLCEDLPHPENRVVLSDQMADRFGIPAPKMIYRFGENSERMIDHGLARAEQVCREAGASEVLLTRFLPQAGFHLMGTARMGADPEDSVTDPYGFCHDVPNLGIVDGSVFVTSAGVNPTPTLTALALRSADHLLNRRDLETPWN